MAKLDREPHIIFRRVAEEVAEPPKVFVIRMEARRKLQQDRSELFLQRSRAFEEFGPRLANIMESLNVRDEARELQREDKIIGRGRIPTLISPDLRQVIERVVDLGATKVLRIEAEVFFGRQIFGIKAAAPVAIVPS